MKNRHIIIIILGLILIYLTYLSKYESNILTVMIWGVLLLLVIILFIVTLYRNILKYSKEKSLKNFFTTYLILGLAVVLCGMEYMIQRDFNKPSLLRVFYDGDFNGTAIDFKEDGTFIFDNSAIGTSSYTYGTYKILGDKITLDKKSLENVIVTDKLEIRKKEPKHTDGIQADKYIYQIDKNSNAMVDETIFKVIVDNRNNYPN